MNRSSPLLGLAALAAITFLATAPASAQGGACLNAAEIQNGVASGQILPLAEVLSIGAPGATPLPVPPVRVCEHGGALYYEIAVRTPSGEATILVLNATTGQP